MTITARYPATCPCCHAAIHAGDQIEWTKGSPARHTACAAGSRSSHPASVAARIAVRTSTYDRRGGRWTGCSCGSREDSAGDLIPSPRNCASCDRDA